MTKTKCVLTTTPYDLVESLPVGRQAGSTQIKTLREDGKEVPIGGEGP